MRPRKLKELLIFAIVHKAPELVPANKKEMLEDGLMKLTTDELEVVEEFVSNIIDSVKPKPRGTRKQEQDNEQEQEQESMVLDIEGEGHIVGSA